MVVPLNGSVEFKRKFPKSIPFILILCLLERVSSIGSNSILLLYLHHKLQFDQLTSTALYHTNEFLTFFFPIIGAVIAESYFGIFKTLLASSLLFCVGTAIVTVGAIELLHLPAIPLTFLGLFMAVFGVGCLRGNITAFGGNQYKLPEEAQIFQLFFSLQIMFVKGGALMSRIFSPVVRQDIKCFGANDCYPLAFGLTLVTMFMAFLITLAGKPFYVHRPVSENIFMKVCGCAFYSLKKKIKSRESNEKNHWLDYAEDRYEPQLIEDTKKVFKILKVFMPVPFFWATYMQQSSRWIFQATRTDGDLGFYTIKPDQMIALNPISSIALIPVCNNVFYPLLSKIKLDGLLARATIGFLLCITAFSISTVIESIIQENRISMLWLAPQWIIVALSENFFHVSILNFAYTEGPANMKSVMTACVYTTTAIGNIFVTLISGSKIFSNQVHEFIFFITILFFAMISFAVLAMNFRKSQDKEKADIEN